MTNHVVLWLQARGYALYQQRTWIVNHVAFESHDTTAGDLVIAGEKLCLGYESHT